MLQNIVYFWEHRCSADYSNLKDLVSAYKQKENGLPCLLQDVCMSPKADGRVEDNTSRGHWCTVTLSLAKTKKITLSEEDIDKIKKDYWTFTSINYWGYLSCFLLFLWFPLNLLFPSLIIHSLLIVIISFSRYIYFMKNDDVYEFSFFNRSSYLTVMFQITLFLYALLGTLSTITSAVEWVECLAPNGYAYYCDELIFY